MSCDGGVEVQLQRPFAAAVATWHSAALLLLHLGRVCIEMQQNTTAHITSFWSQIDQIRKGISLSNA